MSTKKTIIWLVVAVVLLGVAAYFLPYKSWDDTRGSGPDGNVSNQPKVFESEDLGLSFEYPNDYFLEVKSTGNAERYRFTIVLTEDTEANRQIRDGEVVGGEGPTAITVDVFQNTPESYTPLSWVQDVNHSNFKLSNGQTATTTVSGLPAVSYQWSGLYEADATVTATARWVYSFTATYIASTDRTRADLVELIKTVKITP